MKVSNQPRSPRDIVYDIQEASACIRQDNAKIDRLFEELQALVDGPKTVPAGGGTTILQVTDAVVEAIVNCKHDLSDGPQCPLCQHNARRVPSKTLGLLHDHNPVQHRDGKEPWCDICFMTVSGKYLHFPRSIPECPQHILVHRAGDKVAWCGNCGLDANGLLANKERP